MPHKKQIKVNIPYVFVESKLLFDIRKISTTDDYVIPIIVDAWQ